MHLIKWLRKNNTKVMAVVVIFIFIGFVAPDLLNQLSRRRTGKRETVAYFADNKVITNDDVASARQELEILRTLRADNILRGISAPGFRMQDLHATLLAELLFSNRTTSPELIGYIKRLTRTNQYRTGEVQINDIYKCSMPPEIYWLLLKNEAQLAGVRVSNENAGRQLEVAIPQLFKGVTYPQLIGSIVNRQGISEEEILTAFSNLMSVLMYARMICTNENITSSQILHNASWQGETIDVELVKFDSAVFAETAGVPNEEEIVRHFDTYKDCFAGDINDQNPYGFGYKLDDRVQLEYIAVKLEDVSAVITPPTQDEVEEFYQKHRD